MEQEEESKTIMLRGLSLYVTEDDVSSQFSVSPFYPWGKGTRSWCADLFHLLTKFAKTLGALKR